MGIETYLRVRKGVSDKQLGADLVKPTIINGEPPELKPALLRFRK